MRPAAFVLTLLLLGGNLSVEAMGMKPTIQKIKASNEASLMATPGVVSVGIGKDATGQEIIIVGVEQDSAQIRSAIPQQLNGYSVKIQPMGPIKAQ